MSIAPWKRRALALSVGFCLSAGAAPPSDIDIYSSNVPSAVLPNVLLVLDNSANWSTSMTSAPDCFYTSNGVPTTTGPTADQQTKVGLEKCALHNVVDGLPVAANGLGPDNDALFNVGIMLMNQPGADGAYVRQAFIPLTTNNKTTIKSLIRGLDRTSDKASNSDFGLTLFEAYLYYRGKTPLNGLGTASRDTKAVSGSLYRGPSMDSCSSSHIIFIGNGASNNGGAEQQAGTYLAAAVDAEFASETVAVRDALKTQIPDPTGALGTQAKNWSDEVTRFTRRIDFSALGGTQRVTTHAIAVTRGPSDGEYPALMKSIANEGGGSYYEASNVGAITTALLDIFNQAQAVNSVFAAASLPVSTSARGTFLNQIFLGMFRPDEGSAPRWNGNLKQYRFALDSLGALSLTDVNGNPAVSGVTGFLNPAAVSYWTSSSSFWANGPIGTPPSSSDSPDGDVVEKGGVSQRLRSTYATSQSARKVYTCIGCTASTTLGTSAASRFDTGNTALTAGLLGVSTSAERDLLVDWVRGEANRGDEQGPTTTPATTVRPSVHGDVLHSRPAVVNYGGTTGVVVYYGANDGQLRAVKGTTGAGGGEELWSFIPQELIPKLKRLRDNAPDVAVSTTPLAAGAAPKDYFVDGPIGVYQKLGATNAVERVILFVGLRRGGRQLYAIDVTSPTVPKLLWTVTPSTTGMATLGQTWSEAKAARVKGHPNPVLIMGGGYDADAEDAGAATTMGHSIFVLDAFTGALVKRFSGLTGEATGASLSRSIAADVALLDSDYDGYVDRAYAVDLGGQVYRVDFESDAGWASSNWTVYRLANLSGGTTTGRKFFYPPDIVQTGKFVALMVGSGDREKPLMTTTSDHFFQIFDRQVKKGPPDVVAPITWGSLRAMGSAPSSSGNGCYLALSTGEKVVNAATSIAGTTYFGTHKPTPPTASTTSCGRPNLGVAKGYAMPLFCVADAGTTYEGGGLPPSPVAGLVTVNKPDGSPTLVPFVIGAPNARRSAIEGSQVTISVDAPRKRRYWLQETQR